VERANQLPHSLILLRTVPHARAGDETLRFDFAASQAIPPADEPFGTPLLFRMITGHRCSPECLRTRTSARGSWHRRSHGNPQFMEAPNASCNHDPKRGGVILLAAHGSPENGETQTPAACRGKFPGQIFFRRLQAEAAPVFVGGLGLAGAKGLSRRRAIECRAVHYRNAGGRMELKHFFW
jgi:hypothetical protein